MNQWLTGALSVTSLVFFASITWGAKRHFVVPGRVPAGTLLLMIVNLLGWTWFTTKLLLSGVGPGGPYAAVLFAAAVALFWQAVKATRAPRPNAAFVTDQPQTVYQTGPYRLIRHPFYASYVLGWVGTSLATKGLYSWLVLGVLTGIYVGLAWWEERAILKSGQASAYQQYRARTGMFIPSGTFIPWVRVFGGGRRGKAPGISGSGPSDHRSGGPGSRLTALAGWLAETGRWLYPRSVLEYSDEVAAEQALLLARLLQLSAVFGISTVGLLVWEFRATLGAGLIVAAAAIPALYIVLAFQSRRLMLPSDTRASLRSAVIFVSFLGMGWGALVFFAALNARPYQLNVICALMVGLMSTPIITVPLTAAVAFFIPCGVLCLLTVAVAFRPFDLYLFAFFVGWLQFAYISTALLNRISLDRTIARLRLQHQNEITSLFLRNYKENATDWSWEIDTCLRFRNISRRFAMALQAVPPDCRRMPVRYLASSGRIMGLTPLITAFENRQAFRDVVIEVAGETEIKWWSFTGQPIYDAHANFAGYRGIASDITELRRSESQIRYLANHDSLTGLPNRARFVAELDALCAPTPGQPSAQFALLLIDLDRFKEVNDTHGHPVGDALLIAVAKRLRRVLRSDDTAFRLGGDEFAVILNLPGSAEFAAVAERVIATLEEPYSFHDALLRPGASIGLTISPADGCDPAALLRNADLALYEAKASGRGTWCRYLPGMEADKAEAAALRNDLKNAGGPEFTVEYQPIFDLRTSRIIAAEALVRWNHPTRGRISPSEFIPVAEDSGLICDIGAMVLERSCQAAAAWPGRLQVAVNVSALQMRDPEFLPVIDRILAASRLPPDRLQLELTENVLLNADETSFRTIESLYDRGVRVVLDDFGTGYSSLAALIRFRFSGIKIDAQFTSRIESDAKARKIIHSISRIALDLDLPVTAEGVETVGQLDLLAEIGIPRVQGFLMGRPQSAPDFLKMIHEELTAPGAVAWGGRS